MGRAPCCDKGSVKRGPWSPEEDALLRSYVERHGIGGNWIALPQKAGLNRCGKSCRLRWLNYLRPDIKHGGYTEQEDQIICSLYNSIGSRWSIIASKLPGRTDNDVKNYWNTKLKKKALAAMHHAGAMARSQSSPASASASASTSSDACFAALYPPAQAAVVPPRTELAPVPPSVAAVDDWMAPGNAAASFVDDMFLASELAGAGDAAAAAHGEFLFGGGFGLQEKAVELSAWYFPNMAEMWAASSDHVKPQGLCHSLT